MLFRSLTQPPPRLLRRAAIFLLGLQAAQRHEHHVTRNGEDSQRRNIKQHVKRPAADHVDQHGITVSGNQRQVGYAFVGNCEGTDLTSGNFDVVVADGMSGNIALKATEGAAKFLLQELKGAFMASLGTKIAALLIKKQMREIKAKLSGDAKGGAILLGLRGVVLIGHGATSVEAVKNGTLAAAEAVRAGLVENVANSMDGIVL